jgi:hypothetical protein
MNKYTIEGNIDFFSELYKSLEEDDNINNDKNVCLITDKPLTDKYIQLQCGHKFNYVPLFLDIKNHKQKFNQLEGSNTQLKINEIRCPYCRHKHVGILPYYEEFGFSKINGVNADIPGKEYIPLTLCSYLTPNPTYDPSGNLPLETHKNNVGNVKYFICTMSGSKTVNAYLNQEYAGTPLDTDKCYCYNHKKQLVKEYKKELAVKVKEEAKKVKILEKEALKAAKEKAKKAKILEKEAVKTAKEEAKKAAKAVKEEGSNILLETDNVGCTEIIKSGANKGKPCGCKIFMDSICSRHFKIKNNIITNNI